MWYDLNRGMLSQRHQQIARIMKRISPRTTHYKRGEVVYDPFNHKRDRLLIYVEEGNVVLKPKIKPGVALADETSENPAWKSDLVWGKGQFISLSSFLLGTNSTFDVAYAYSDFVVVRIWILPSQYKETSGPPGTKRKKQNDLPLSPIMIEGLEPQDVDILYEELAGEAMQMTRSVDMSMLASKGSSHVLAAK